VTRRSLLLSAAASAAVGKASPRSSALPSPIGAVPSSRQLRWHEMEFYGFLHFTVNTFTDREWGEGDEDPSIFAPTNFDPDAILQGLAASGMKGVILTCKHHDGFCLWPTKTTDHCIRKSKWRDGKGDVVRDIAQAAKRHGLKFGVYLSPWDRNNALYGKPEYIQLYRQQLTELLTNYGPLFEIWHDGANGGTGFYGGAHEKRTIDKKSYYDWPNTWNLARSLQPDAVIFSDVGPDIRWVGNEKGQAGDPCWETYTPVAKDGGPAAPGDSKESENNSGTRNGAKWMPAECDVSIRPGWFWHAAENDKVKTPRQLLDLYYKSVGRGASFLLNVPPTRTGQLHENDVAALHGFGELLRKTFAQNLAAHAKLTASNVRGSNLDKFGPKHLLTEDRSTYWATDDGVNTPEVMFDLQRPITFNVIRIREAIQFGQRIGGIALEQSVAGTWRPVATAASIGACRLIRLESPSTATQLRLRITESTAAPVLTEVSFFMEAT
jgi:alpha-L-fucosidase